MSDQSDPKIGCAGTFRSKSLYIYIVTVLVESYALESIWMLIIAVLLTVGHSLSRVFTNCLVYIEVSY